ncbi:uncharacterized protein FFNC_15341 [Fusarium fujikuroi]|nr:uncharacterized protein FFNC_15341 [Fusarium fujikuroi]
MAISIEESTQALDIFLNHYAKSTKNLASIGSSKGFPLKSDAARGDIGSGLEVVRDCFSSARGATFRVLININPSHGAFYHTGPLSMLMTSHVVRNTIKLERFLKSLRIQTAHLLERRNRASEAILRVKTIFGLARTDDGHGLAHPPPVKKHGTGADDVEFWLDGEASSPVTPQAAVRADTRKSKGKEYNRVLQNTQLPVVNCGNRDNPMYLPAEVCAVLPGQPSKLKLDSAQARHTIRHAVRNPRENAVVIVGEGVQTGGLDEKINTLFRSFGLKSTPGVIKVPGRVLADPKVIYMNNKAANPRLGSWNMMDVRFIIAASLPR